MVALAGSDAAPLPTNAHAERLDLSYNYLLTIVADSAEIPAANGHGDARSLARLYGALACGGELDGVHVLSREAIARATPSRRSERTR